MCLLLVGGLLVQSTHGAWLTDTVGIKGRSASELDRMFEARLPARKFRAWQWMETFDESKVDNDGVALEKDGVAVSAFERS